MRKFFFSANLKIFFDQVYIIKCNNFLQIFFCKLSWHYVAIKMYMYNNINCVQDETEKASTECSLTGGRLSLPTKDARSIATWRRTVRTTWGAVSSRLSRRTRVIITWKIILKLQGSRTEQLFMSGAARILTGNGVQENILSPDYTGGRHDQGWPGVRWEARQEDGRHAYDQGSTSYLCSDDKMEYLHTYGQMPGWDGSHLGARGEQCKAAPGLTRHDESSDHGFHQIWHV